MRPPGFIHPNRGWIKQFDQLVRERTAELIGVDQGERASVITSDIVADAERGKFHLLRSLYLGDDLAQVVFEERTAIGGQRGIIDRRAVADHYQNFTPLDPRA